MTEQELDNAIAAGAVETIQPPAPADDSADATADLSTIPGLEQVVTAMRMPRYGLDAMPTSTPQMFTDQIQFVDDGTDPVYIAAYIDGNWVAFKQAAAPTPPFVPSAQFLDFLNWHSIDGLNVTTTGTTSVNPEGSSLNFNMGNGGTATVAHKNGYAGLFNEGTITVEFTIFNGLGGATNQAVYLFLNDGPTLSSLAASAHVGFKMLTFGSGYAAATIYGSTSDGSTESVTGALGTIGTTTEIQRLRVVYTPGLSAQFYVNDVLQATITAHLPASGITPTLFMYFYTPVAENFFLGRVLIEKTYS